MTIYNPSNLPKDDNLSRFAFVIDVNDEMFIQKGKMIAYYGQLKFEALGSSLLSILVKQAFNAPLYVNHFVVANGKGQLILGDNGNDIASYDLDNANMTIKAKHLLGFTKGLTCQESTLPGYLTLLGTGKLLASSNGPVHFLELPCRVDEQAVLGWADCPSPSYFYDYEYINGYVAAVGAMTGFTSSGEEKQVDFVGQGTVLMQSSEMGLIGHSTLQSIVSQLPLLGTNELGQLNNTITQRMRGQG